LSYRQAILESIGEWLARLFSRSGGDRQRLGRRGESVACRVLARKGYQILARRLRSRRGEIDIVAREGGALVFIEVKTRRPGRFGRPVDAVGPRKQRRLVALARSFLKRRRLAGERVRFDVVSVEIEPGRAARVEVHRGAFEETFCV
jgi:putative endonuclease